MKFALGAPHIAQVLEPRRNPAELPIPASVSYRPLCSDPMAVFREASLSAADAAMDRYATGEDDAFPVLYDVLAPRIYQYLLRSTQDKARAEDILQQTFFNMHCARGRFIQGASVAAWAFTIAGRLHKDELRRAARRPDTPRDTATMNASTPELRPDRLLEAQLAESAMHDTLAQLPRSQRLAFELVKCNGLSFAEVADILGTTVPAIKALTHRAYCALRTTLQDEDQA
jgi:RNA polymerase sigma-70 factor (ECF subfamily)